MNRQVKVLRRDREVAAVSYRDNNGIWQGRIVPLNAVSSENRITIVSDETLNAGTEYGFDWDVVYPDPVVISGANLTQALRVHNIWTLEDLLANPNEALAAILSLARRFHTEMIKNAKDCIVRQ